MGNKELLHGFKQESKEINSELKIYANCGVKNGFKWGRGENRRPNRMLLQ